jgi:hypothetical protein
MSRRGPGSSERTSLRPGKFLTEAAGAGGVTVTSSMIASGMATADRRRGFRLPFPSLARSESVQYSVPGPVYYTRLTGNGRVRGSSTAKSLL